MNKASTHFLLLLITPFVFNGCFLPPTGHGSRDTHLPQHYDKKPKHDRDFHKSPNHR